jgi:flagellar biosynthesis GTPase FlhF
LDVVDKECSHWFQALVDLGLESELARELVRRAQYMIPPAKRSDDTAFYKVMSKLIKNRLVCSEYWEFKPGRPLVVVVGGLPGSGKSHLVNSLALHYKVKQNKEVGIINLDHFRLGADQALASFSRVTQIQTTTTYTLKDAEEWLHRWSDQDLILIDTPGTSPNDKDLWEELRGLIGSVQPDRCIWVADSTMRHRDLVENCRRFKTLGFNELAFSKLDIAQAKGCVYNLSQVCKMPIGPISRSRDVMENTNFPNANECLEWILPKMEPSYSE